MPCPGPNRSGAYLRRPTDRLRTAVGWLLVVAAVALVVCAGMAAASAYRSGLDRIQRDAAARTTVVGMLLDDATPAGAEPVHPARVAYVDPQGRARVGQVSISGPLRTGTSVRVEVDANGAVGTDPPTTGDAVFSAATAAVAVVLFGGLLLAATWFGTRFLVTTRNHVAWEREWRLVEPQWSGRGTATF